ncbi:MAG: SAM-dependent methyltransferase, partial [Myxococcales bacterium]|nr:SAM-dependent methyltransferase [Myxococcales bacterium]
MSEPMTATMPQATRKALSSTIRDLRARLIADLGGALTARYRLALPLQSADLLPRRRTWRLRLEQHFDQAGRATHAAKGSPKYQAGYDRARAALVEQAAYTWLNRLVCLRLFEARGLVGPAVITGGWDSPAYQQWREVAPARVYGAAAQGDDTAGFRALLDRVFAELALDLPGLFAPGGLVEAVPLPPQTLRAVVEALNAPALADAWADELLLGWVYQYFNDPAREALDAKLNDGGKVEPHEIASKTQLFTERYMV